ncbi:hypothetical protein D3C74_362720 [compost metagenome]
MIMLNPAAARLLYCMEVSRELHRCEQLGRNSTAIIVNAHSVRDRISNGVPYFKISRAINSVVSVVPIFPPRIMPRVRA